MALLVSSIFRLLTARPLPGRRSAYLRLAACRLLLVPGLALPFFLPLSLSLSPAAAQTLEGEAPAGIAGELSGEATAPEIAPGRAADPLPADPALGGGMIDHPLIKLQSLDKITARTMTFEARVGSTLKYGTLYIKIQSCRKTPPMRTPESAAFLQIWEVTPEAEAKWVFSGWMFASSPALSPMDHPVYDVWVIDCMEPPAPAEAAAVEAAPDGSEKELSPEEQDKQIDVEELSPLGD